MINRIERFENNEIIISAVQIGNEFEVMAMNHNHDELEVIRTDSRTKAYGTFDDMVKRYTEKKHNALKVTAKMQGLIDALEAAKAAALKARNLNEDGGACNFDSPSIALPRWKMAEVEACAKAAGLSCYSWKSWSGKRWVFTVPGPCGQGNCRSRMAEAMTAALSSFGFDAVTYYQMD